MNRTTKNRSGPFARSSRRERQIMDIVYRLGAATAADIREQMEDAPTYTTVRGLLRILAEKGLLEIGRAGPRYVYRPTVAPTSAGREMIAHVTRTFFGGSPSRALHALLGHTDLQVTEAELERLQRLVDGYGAERGRR